MEMVEIVGFWMFEDRANRFVEEMDVDCMRAIRMDAKVFGLSNLKMPFSEFGKIPGETQTGGRQEFGFGDKFNISYASNLRCPEGIETSTELKFTGELCCREKYVEYIYM